MKSISRKTLKNIGIAVAAILILIQFYRPARNLSNDDTYAIGKKYPVPDSIETILKSSCYDCHSNNTVYPWYANIQPVAFWLEDHVHEGKEKLNFSKFQKYRINRQYHMLEEISKNIKEDEMPLSSYTFIHTKSKLSPEQKMQVRNWADGIAASMKASYPADSLIYKKKSKKTD